VLLSTAKQFSILQQLNNFTAKQFIVSVNS